MKRREKGWGAGSDKEEETKLCVLYVGEARLSDTLLQPFFQLMRSFMLKCLGTDHKIHVTKRKGLLGGQHIMSLIQKQTISSHHPRGCPNCGTRRRSCLKTSLPYFLMVAKFVNSQQKGPATGCTHRQLLNSMIADYIGSRADVDTIRSKDPQDYWVSKLNPWPELAQYSLEPLA